MIDLRSDTVTKPTPAMLDAMMAAEVGDDVYGEDVSVNLLEEEVAALMGKEAALFVPSGTMANQIAIALHTRPGEAIIAEENTHCFLYEAGAAAALSGVQFDLIPAEKNLSDDAIDAAFKPEWTHYASTSLLVAENTHTRLAGRALTAETMDRIAAKAHTLGIKAHCDGARIWNAAVATGVTEKRLVAGYDTVAVCFSKGLGAPVGSALLGPKSMLERARKLRKRWGGAMRQSGYLAAAARFALRNHRARLEVDHGHAAMLTAALSDLRMRGLNVEMATPAIPSNMVFFRSGPDGDKWVRALASQGVLISSMGQGWMRAVTHLQVDAFNMTRAVEAIATTLRKA